MAGEGDQSGTVASLGVLPEMEGGGGGVDTGTQRSQSLLVLTTRGEFFPTPLSPTSPSPVLSLLKIERNVVKVNS